jgi:hypothetical protein
LPVSGLVFVGRKPAGLLSSALLGISEQFLHLRDQAGVPVPRWSSLRHFFQEGTKQAKRCFPLPWIARKARFLRSLPDNPDRIGVLDSRFWFNGIRNACLRQHSLTVDLKAEVS